MNRVPGHVRHEPREGRITAVRVDLLGSEPEPARILRDRTTDLVTPAQEQDEVLGAAEALVSGASPEEAGEAMTDVGAGYLLLQASADHPLAAQIDRVNGLTRVSGPPDQVLENPQEERTKEFFARFL